VSLSRGVTFRIQRMPSGHGIWSYPSVRTAIPVWIGGTDILDYSPLADLVNLQYLTVWGGTVQIKPSLSRLTKLRSLSIWDYGASDLSFLEDLPKLESLLLNGNEITNISALRGLTGLRSLTLWGTRVEDLYPLQSLPILQQLNLDYTKIDPAQVDALKEANPALWVRQTI
jgi:hypothetical protein